MDSSVKVALIGCGRISGHHARSIVGLNGVDLIAVCDLDLKKAQAYSDEFGASAYESYHQMLDELSLIHI